MGKIPPMHLLKMSWKKTHLFDSEQQIGTKEIFTNYFSKVRDRKIPIQKYMSEKEAIKSMPLSIHLKRNSDDSIRLEYKARIHKHCDLWQVEISRRIVQDL